MRRNDSNTVSKENKLRFKLFYKFLQIVLWNSKLVTYMKLTTFLRCHRVNIIIGGYNMTGLCTILLFARYLFLRRSCKLFLLWNEIYNFVLMLISHFSHSAESRRLSLEKQNLFIYKQFVWPLKSLRYNSLWIIFWSKKYITK
jgi:hypothetical protein